VGEIIDILKEIPLSAAIKKRLIDKETEIAALKTENAELKVKLQQIKSDKTINDYICPYCQYLTGKLLDERPTFYLGQFGLKTRNFECENCHKKYEKSYQP
jgi:cell division protein FtsB